MDKNIEKLIKILKKNGVSHYKDGALELKFAETEPKIRKKQTSAKEMKAIEKANADISAEEVLDELIVTDPMAYEQAMADILKKTN